LTNYRAKQTVKAVQWQEDNLQEMIDLLRDVVEKDAEGNPCVYAQEVEPYFLRSLGYRQGYMILTFYAGDDMEVDPGIWVVVYEDGEVETMENEQFNKMFEVIV
jgi:hypothetical protein